MTPEQIKVLAQRFLDQVFVQRNMDALDELFVPDAVIHDPGAEYRGTAAIRLGIEALFAGFPDFQFNVEDQIAEHDRIAIRFRGGGTHDGPWRGLQPTGKSMRYTGVVIMRFEGQRIAEYWGQSDVLSILQQLGVVPTTIG
jgi:predicted ester cyclase